MLTPTDVHLLVGLLTQTARPDGIDFELGSMVFDAVAEEDRDVDITLRVVNENDGTSVFEGIEVKHHKRPLDVSHVEQLCAKLRDMPAIKRAGIVSGSGYTEPAVRKARYHDVTLYSLVDWAAPMRIGDVSISDQFALRERHYEWVGHYQVNFNSDIGAIDVKPDTPVYDKDGAQLTDSPTLVRLAEILASRVPGIIQQGEASLQINLGETKPISIDLNLSDEPFIMVGSAKLTLNRVRITGQMAYVERTIPPDFKVLLRHEDQKPFVACAVSEIASGNLMGISLDPDRRLQIIHIPIADRLLKKIYRRRLGSTASPKASECAPD